MAEQSKIEWTHHTFNPWTGCSKVHTGCKNCYAEVLVDKRFGWSEWGPDGSRTRTSDANWRKPISWNRGAIGAGERHRVFCASLADVFEDRGDLAPWRRDLFELIDETPNLDWLLLTKRPENIIRMWPDDEFRANVWLGTSVSDQDTGTKWIQRLVQNRHLSPVLFLSVEPLIGPVELTRLDQIDWVIVGGESGHGARRCENAWVRSVVRQCRAANMPVFVKQLGNRNDLRDKKGGDMEEWPGDLRVREFPTAQVELAV